MATGGGHSRLNETIGVLGVPTMSQKSFVQTEREIGEWWKQELEGSMKAAGEEERRLAIDNNQFHEGVPAITVILDGGWLKRTHKHSYNAKSGVGVIIGHRTQKLLYIGVKNKDCTACARGIQNHVCYKNWSDSSSAMESAIILEGFLQAESTHGVRYTKFVGDGDSSVHTTLITDVPGWGRAIEKLECANHACKCYRGSLEKIVQDNPHYKGKGGLTTKMRQRLTSAARCAIKMRSRETDRSQTVKKLQADLRNGLHHCFGMHDNCSADFCATVRERQKQEADMQGCSGNPNLLNEDEGSLPDVAAEQVSICHFFN